MLEIKSNPMENFWQEVGDFLFFTWEVFCALVIIALVFRGLQKLTSKEQKVEKNEQKEWLN